MKINYLYSYRGETIKNYIFFALYLFIRPKLLILVFKGVYLPQYIQYEWISRFRISTFIDIGANDGNISKAINYISPKTTIFAFEPIKQKKSIIESKIKSDNLTVETLALGDHTGIQEFYEYDFLPASSFLKPDPKIFGKKIAKSYPVKITTLDQYFDKKKFKKPVFIKMDTEGTENLIIRGGQKLLRQASLIIIETSFIKHRKNQCLFDEIHSYLIKLGFTYKGSMPDSNYYPIFGPTRVENSIFIRKEEISN